MNAPRQPDIATKQFTSEVVQKFSSFSPDPCEHPQGLVVT
jgi:hypothetical protein